MNNRRVLFVDDEPILLDTYRRLLGREFEVRTAEGPEAGLVAIGEKGPFAVIASDLRMPGMNGIEFLSRARLIAPNSVRFMLTGFADTSAAIAAVNEGCIFRFLQKPCPHEQLVMALDAGVEQYRLITAERELLEQTLAGSIRMLTEIVGLTHSGVMGRSSRLRRTMGHLARELKLPNAWQYELAGLLSQIGCLTIQPEILEKVWAGQDLSPGDDAIYRSHPAIGSQLLSNIPRMSSVARIIALQLAPAQADAAGAAEDSGLLQGGRMLQASVEFDQLLARGLSVPEAVERMRRSASGYPPGMLDALATFDLGRKPRILKVVGIRDLDDRMVFAQDVVARNGMLLMAKGHEVNGPVKFRLSSFAAGVGVIEPIRVWITDEDQTDRVAA